MNTLVARIAATILLSLVLSASSFAQLLPSPPSFQYPFWLKHGQSRIDSIVLPNSTPGPITVSAVGTVQTTGPGIWLTVSPAGPVIIPVAGSLTISVTFNPGGTINTPGTIINLQGYIYVLSDQPDPSDSVAIPINVNIADTVVATRYDTIFTACTRLVARNDGNLGNDGQGKVNLDYWYNGECDTDLTVPGRTEVYLNTGTPVIIRKPAGTILNASWGGFGNDFTSPNGFRPVMDQVSPIFNFGEFSGPGYTALRSGQFVTSDSAVAVERTIFAPTGASNCNFLIIATRIFGFKPGAVSGLSVGELIDWDVPSDTANANEVAFDISRPGLIYQRGVEQNTDNTIECQDNNRRFGGMYHVSTCGIAGFGPAQALWARPISELMDLQGDLDAFLLWSYLQFTSDGIPGSPSQADWVSAMNIKSSFTLGDNDTLQYTYVLAGQRSGTLVQFHAIADAAKSWTSSLIGPGLWCVPEVCGCCSGLVGNADSDPTQTVDLSDLQFYIDYLFFSGPSSSCECEFDTNNDAAVDISDLQAIIDYLFFGAMLNNCY